MNKLAQIRRQGQIDGYNAVMEKVAEGKEEYSYGTHVKERAKGGVTHGIPAALAGGATGAIIGGFKGRPGLGAGIGAYLGGAVGANVGAVRKGQQYTSKVTGRDTGYLESEGANMPTLDKTISRGVIGAGLGGVAGAGLGLLAKRPAEGALLGAGIGGVGGALQGSATGMKEHFSKKD